MGINMLLIQRIAERKIQEAIDNGEFENLPGKGNPLKFDKEPRMPDSCRTSYKLLKNAGVLPEEMQLKKEIYSIQELLDVCEDDAERKKLRKKMNAKQLRYDLLMERRSSKGASYSRYKAKIFSKFR